MEKKLFGRHLIIDAAITDKGVATIADPKQMRDLAIEVSNVAKMHLVFPPLCTKFEFSKDAKNPVELLDDNDQYRVQWPVLQTAEKTLQTKNELDTGVSCGALWVESHFYSHGWNAFKYISFDMFTCRDFEIEPVIECIANYIDAKELYITDMRRYMNAPQEMTTFTRTYEREETCAAV